LLGKALVHTPHILVLDEPTAGVDIALRDMLWRNVRKLNQAGMTIILTTHYLEEAQEMCDEIAIINHGEVVVQDSTENLLDRLDAKSLVIYPRKTPQTEIKLPDGVSLSTQDDGSLIFSYKRGQTTAEDVLDAVRLAGIQINDVKSRDPDLEDVFLDLTHGAK